MSQVTTTRPIQSSFSRPTSGSTQNRSQTLLKPPSFSSKIFPPKSNNPPKLCFRTSPINARKSSSAEVVPVSPEDDSKVRSLSISFSYSASVSYFIRKKKRWVSEKI